MERIKDTIQTVIQDWHVPEKKSGQSDPGEVLKKVLAKKALKHVQLYTLRKGIFTIKVDSSSWLYYLSLQKEDLLKNLKKETNEIKEIRFSLGE